MGKNLQKNSQAAISLPDHKLYTAFLAFVSTLLDVKPMRSAWIVWKDSRRFLENPEAV